MTVSGKPDATIRPLTPADAFAFRHLRLTALSDSPQSFSASAVEETALSDDEMAARAAPAAPSVIFGAFDGASLVGMAGFVANHRQKTRHKGVMVGVYVTPEWRAAGIGRRLVETVKAHAASLGVILQCTVTSANEPARRLYLALGFLPYGLERDALFVDGDYIDEELLAIDLRKIAAQ